MSKSRVIVKYHNGRMLLTVDLNALFSTLFAALADDVAIEFMAMDDQEKNLSSVLLELTFRRWPRRFPGIYRRAGGPATPARRLAGPGPGGE